MRVYDSLQPSNHAVLHARPCVSAYQRTSHESNSRAMGKGRSGLIFCTVDLLREGERGERIGYFSVFQCKSLFAYATRERIAIIKLFRCLVFYS